MGLFHQICLRERLGRKILLCDKGERKREKKFQSGPTAQKRRGHTTSMKYRNPVTNLKKERQKVKACVRNLQGNCFLFELGRMKVASVCVLTGLGLPSARHLILAPLELEKATESGRSRRRRRTVEGEEEEGDEDAADAADTADAAGKEEGGEKFMGGCHEWEGRNGGERGAYARNGTNRPRGRWKEEKEFIKAKA